MPYEGDRGTIFHIDTSMPIFQWGVESADSVPVCWLLCSLTDVTVNMLASIIISVSQCTGSGWGPVRLPFCLGSLCSPADVSETHTCSGALKRTGAIRHSSRNACFVRTRPWFQSNSPKTVGQWTSLVVSPPT